MNLPRVRLALILLFSVAFTAPALAQYMYLDSNGDGIHTSADQVNAVGPTVIDVWLDTDSNRDGSVAVCNDISEPLSIFSYVFVLRATGGTVAWGQFTNHQAGMGVLFGERISATEYRNGRGGQVGPPPGIYRLATIQIAVATGTPSIQIAPQETAGPETTNFGSPCPGVDFLHSIRLGADWFDADGLPFGAGGGSNTAPILVQPSNMNLSIGETASQTVTASDADRQPVTFSKVSGPAFAAVTTVDPGSGTAAGRVYLSPRIGDVGTAMVTVGATDGIASDQETFAVTVISGPNHEPVLVGTNETDVVAGFSHRLRLEALDPDGQALTFAKNAGPDFATVSTLWSGPGAAAGSLGLTPTLCEAGTSRITVAVTDGVSSSQIELPLLVRSLSPAVPSPPPTPLPGRGTAIAVADLNSDGRLDVVAASQSTPTRISILLGNGDATFDAVTGLDIAGIEPTSIAVEDFNGDEHPDIAVTTVSGNLQVFLGRGDGTFTPGSTLTPLSLPFHVIAADVNADGTQDLIIGGEGSSVSLFLGTGDGTFGARQGIDVGGVQRWLAMADFDRDGVLDLAVSMFQKRTVVVMHGFGDGNFGNRREIPFGGIPYAIIAGDWNWDGSIDLAVSGYEGYRVIPFLGDGEGDFATAAEIAGFFSPQSLATADFNGDGNLDLLVGDPSGPSVGSTQIAYGAGDGRFAAPRPVGQTTFGIATGDMNEDGFPDAVAVDGGVNVWLNDAGGLGAAQARAFERDDVLRPLPILSAVGPECLRLEPVGGSYQNSELNYGSITLRSEGTGSVDEIRAIPLHRSTQRDLDRNGVAEVPVCFERRDFTHLFDKIQGRRTVTAQIEGALANGRRFCTSVALDIVNHKRRFFAHLTPNPLNPQATLKFSTTGDGFVRVRVFDLNGRLVRTLLDSSQLPAGDHEVVIDGRGRNGERLASGVYFYRIEAQEGSIQGRMTVLK